MSALQQHKLFVFYLKWEGATDRLPKKHFHSIIISNVSHKLFTISNTKDYFLSTTSAQPLHPSISIQNPSHVHMVFASTICQHLDKYLQIKIHNGSQKISPYKIFVR